MRSEVILLAGGLSSRTKGLPKGLIPVGGKPWIARQLDSLLEIGFKKIHVVLGFHAERYQPLVPASCTVHLNRIPELGPFSSLRSALAHTEGNTFLLPMDTPCPSEWVWRALETELKNSAVAIPTCDKQGGHPVLLSVDFQKQLKTIELDSEMARLDYQIWQLPEEKVMRVSVAESSVIQNLNTRTDFDRLLRE